MEGRVRSSKLFFFHWLSSDRPGSILFDEFSLPWTQPTKSHKPPFVDIMDRTADLYEAHDFSYLAYREPIRAFALLSSAISLLEGSLSSVFKE
jgi:hypothetical protein